MVNPFDILRREAISLCGVGRAIQFRNGRLSVSRESKRAVHHDRTKVQEARVIPCTASRFREVVLPSRLDILEVDNAAVRESQIKRLQEVKTSRNQADVDAASEAIANAAESGEGNLLALAVTAAKAKATYF